MASTSVSSVQKSFKYDVFLSFRGEDTRKNFVDHLYHALKHKSIVTYKDDENVKQGKIISDELIKAIQDSKFYVIIFSKNYASSSWCLDELVKIMECQTMDEHAAYPVFYDVEPTEVRKQSGSVGDAFSKHNKEDEAAWKWREALKEASELAGWEHEAKVIQKIVGEISLESRFINSSIDGNLISMETRVNEVISSLEPDVGDVRMLGIWGMGGAGKKTLARAVFNQISFQFEDILDDQDVTVSGVLDGKNKMKKTMRGRKVLVVLDDVDDKDQLEALAGDCNWFKPGSRIIITTRDKQVLVAHRVSLIHNVTLLSQAEAGCLFNRYAFGKENPIQGYEALSGKVLQYADGLPLTIKVMGSFLCGQDESEWKDAIKRLETIPLKKTMEDYASSSWCLEELVKIMECQTMDEHTAYPVFFDVEPTEVRKQSGEVGVAFARHKKEKAARKWREALKEASYLAGWELKSIANGGEDTRKNFVDHLYQALKDKGIYTYKDDEKIQKGERITDELIEAIEDSKFYIIVFSKDYASSSWCLEELVKIMECQTMDEHTAYPVFFDVEPTEVRKQSGEVGVAFARHKKEKAARKWREALKEASYLAGWELKSIANGNTPNLKTLEFEGLYNLEEFQIPSEKLKMPGESLKLALLDLSHSKLKTIHLGSTPNLESLLLEGCNDLVELEMPSECLKIENLNQSFKVGYLKKLAFLNLSGCGRFEYFVFDKRSQTATEAGSLSELHLIAIAEPNSFPKFRFRCFYKEDPASSFGNLETLISMGLCACTNLENPLTSICSLRGLRKLKLEGSITEAPRDLDQLECLEELIFSSTNIRNLPDSICKLKHLKSLELKSCLLLEKLPDDLGRIDSLKTLIITDCNRLRDIPNNIDVGVWALYEMLINLWTAMESAKLKEILDLALQFDNACTTKDDIRKANEKCVDIPQESRALINTFLKEESDKDYELNLLIYEKAAKLKKQMNDKLIWLREKYNYESQTHIGGSSSQTHVICDVYLTVKEIHHLHLDEEALEETLEEESMAEKEREEKIRQKQANDELFMLEFGVKYESEYESD
nr:TMV resistance protein N-like [Tanacetum cinerariifolium]